MDRRLASGLVSCPILTSCGEARIACLGVDLGALTKKTRGPTAPEQKRGTSRLDSADGLLVVAGDLHLVETFCFIGVFVDEQGLGLAANDGGIDHHLVYVPLGRN